MLQRLLLLGALAVPTASAQGPTFTRVYPLRPDEGVFAYARISPDGNLLVYASQAFAPNPRAVRAPENQYGPSGGVISQTVTVVDLRTRKILFSEDGIDGYWSPNGQRIIYAAKGVSLWNLRTGVVSRGVAPSQLGDYYSWGTRDGQDLILTINSNYYYLKGEKAVLPHSRVTSCAGIGTGERPLLSHDGMQITTFVRGTIVVRDLTDCQNIFDTGIQGAKADWSWDNRYIAFHAPKRDGKGYEIRVVDVRQHTVRTVTDLPGSSLFPSWTQDGRLCFRYDSDDYRGFMMASNVLGVPARPLPRVSDRIPMQRSWSDIFPESRLPGSQLKLVMVWSPWSAHSPAALRDLQRARDYFADRKFDVAVATATEPGSRPEDISRMLAEQRITLTRLPLDPRRLPLTEAQNQIPVTLLFRGEQLVDRRLGAQTFDQLVTWVSSAQLRTVPE